MHAHTHRQRERERTDQLSGELTDIHTPPQQTKHLHLTTRCSTAESEYLRTFLKILVFKIKNNNTFICDTLR
jgi:hypothetical protein